jgi:hypothetical protein
MYTCKKISTYTGKTIAKEVFDNLDQAIKFCNSNISATGSYQWLLFTNKFIKN